MHMLNVCHSHDALKKWHHRHITICVCCDKSGEYEICNTSKRKCLTAPPGGADSTEITPPLLGPFCRAKFLAGAVGEKWIITEEAAQSLEFGHNNTWGCDLRVIRTPGVRSPCYLHPWGAFSVLSAPKGGADEAYQSKKAIFALTILFWKSATKWFG